MTKSFWVLDDVDIGENVYYSKHYDMLVKLQEKLGKDRDPEDVPVIKEYSREYERDVRVSIDDVEEDLDELESQIDCVDIITEYSSRGFTEISYANPLEY